MKVTTLQGYMGLCSEYGWKPTWQGLFAFEAGVREQYIKNRPTENGKAEQLMRGD